MRSALFLTWVAFISGPLVIFAQTNPAKLATSGRFDLVAATAVGSLTNGSVTTAGGSIVRPSWLSQEEQTRAYTITFPMVRFATNDVAVAFVPLKSGSVKISLMGPWEEASPGVLYREEIF